MRLIDADALEEKAWRFGLGTREDVANLIRNAPTVDAEPVVRCKDCVYYGEYTNYIKGKFCIKHSHLNDDFVFHCDEDDFCSWGERREDEID